MAVDELRGRVSASVEVVALDRPGAALINWMRDCRHLVLIDAVLLAPDRRGGYAALSPEDLARPAPVSGHGVDLAQTLALAAALGQEPESVEIYGIFISDLENISEAVSSGARRLAEDLGERLQAMATTPLAGS